MKELCTLPPRRRGGAGHPGRRPPRAAADDLFGFLSLAARNNTNDGGPVPNRSGGCAPPGTTAQDNRPPALQLLEGPVTLARAPRRPDPDPDPRPVSASALTCPPAPARPPPSHKAPPGFTNPTGNPGSPRPRSVRSVTSAERLRPGEGSRTCPGSGDPDTRPLGSLLCGPQASCVSHAEMSGAPPTLLSSTWPPPALFRLQLWGAAAPLPVRTPGLGPSAGRASRASPLAGAGGSCLPRSQRSVGTWSALGVPTPGL